MFTVEKSKIDELIQFLKENHQHVKFTVDKYNVAKIYTLTINKNADDDTKIWFAIENPSLKEFENMRRLFDYINVLTFKATENFEHDKKTLKELCKQNDVTFRIKQKKVYNGAHGHGYKIFLLAFNGQGEKTVVTNYAHVMTNTVWTNFYSKLIEQCKNEILGEC